MKRALAIAGGVIFGPLIVAAIAFALGRASMKIDPVDRLGPDGRQAAVTLVRAVLDGVAVPDSAGELARSLPGPGTVRLELWAAGTLIARSEGHGVTIHAALTDGARLLAEAVRAATGSLATSAEARLTVALVIGRGPLPSRPKILRAMGVVPGIDGLAVEVEGREVILYPDDLVRARLFSGTPPAKGIEVSVGMDMVHAEGLLARRAQLPPGTFGAVPKRYHRIRVDAFVEASQVGAPPLPLVRGHAPRPPVTSTGLIEGARAGARFLAALVGANGRYTYEVDLTTGAPPRPSASGSYSMPRHAGTTYFLAQVYATTGDPELGAAIDRALGYLEGLINRGKCNGEQAGVKWSCVADSNIASTGSTALALVAFAEYRLATGDMRWDDLIKRLAEWLMWLERPDGGFVHLFDVKAKSKDERTRLLYFDGEAALGLVRAYRIFGDRRYLDAAGRALDATLRSYDFFAGKFFFGEEHWTCLAAEAAWPELNADRYREFCTDYATFLRSQQFDDGIPGQEDLDGAYGVTPFVMPNNTPTGSRTETMIAAYDLTVHHGRPDERIRAQNLAALGYLLSQQIGPELAPMVKLARPVGGVPASASDPVVRIDYVQHVCSAMLRGARLAPGADGIVGLYPPNAVSPPRRPTPVVDPTP